MASSKSINNTKIVKSDTNSFLIIGSDSKYNNCIFGNSSYGDNFYKIKIKDETGYVLDLMKTSQLQSVKFNGSGGVLKDAFFAGGPTPSYIENVRLEGKAEIASGNIHFINSNVIVEDTLTRSVGWARTLYVIGDLTNNGVITSSGFTIDITGNAMNNGIWNNSLNIMSGTTDQTFINADSLHSGFNLMANVASATTYQWYKNGVLISGATNANYQMNAPTNVSDIYGDYNCQTDAGNSRKLTLQKGNAVLSANFSSDITSGTAPLTVQFTDASTGNPISWSWDFGDGQTSTMQNPSHIFTYDGNYTISLTVSDGISTNTEVKDSYIKVGPSSIEEMIAQSIDLYPNPAKGMVQFKSEFEINTIKIYDYRGKLVNDIVVNDNSVTINIENIKPGIYMIQANIENHTITRKLIVNK